MDGTPRMVMWIKVFNIHSIYIKLQFIQAQNNSCHETITMDWIMLLDSTGDGYPTITLFKSQSTFAIELYLSIAKYY